MKRALLLIVLLLPFVGRSAAPLDAVATGKSEELKCIIWINRGRAALDRGDLKAAIAYFDRAVALSPNDELAYTNRAYAKVLGDDFAGAIADFTRAISLNPTSGICCYNRGHAKSDMRDFVGALTDYNRAIGLDPKYAEAYVNRGFVLRALGHWEAAIADFNRAIAINPKLKQAYQNRAMAYATVGKWSDALADQRQFCALSDQKGYPLYFIWLFRSRLGEAEAATQELSATLNQSLPGAPTDWVSTLGEFLIGKRTESELLAVAVCAERKKDRKQHCEAWFYAGIKKLLARDTVAATADFRECLATEQRNLDEYELAAAELNTPAPPSAKKTWQGGGDDHGQEHRASE